MYKLVPDARVLAFMAGLLEGDGNLYANSNRHYVRIYSPDLSEVLWLTRVSKQVLGKYPIIGIDKPRNNKKLYLFRLEYHDQGTYRFFRELDLTTLSRLEVMNFISGIIYAEGHLKIRRTKSGIRLSVLEIELKKKLSVTKLLKAFDLINVEIKYYERKTRGHKVYYIDDRDTIEKLMDIVHLNWKWYKFLALKNETRFCEYAVIKLIDHVILNQVIGKFFLGHSLSVEEKHVLKEFIGANYVYKKIKTRAKLLDSSPLNTVDDFPRLINKLRVDYTKYLRYLQNNELKLISNMCFNVFKELCCKNAD
ncbi:MAG: hypothetical protein J7L12_04515 [Desulfurococcales archaeon]|nr:hypothetical protein [Desulfurococcales archaeon]